MLGDSDVSLLRISVRVSIDCEGTCMRDRSISRGIDVQLIAEVGGFVVPAAHLVAEKFLARRGGTDNIHRRGARATCPFGSRD